MVNRGMAERGRRGCQHRRVQSFENGGTPIHGGSWRCDPQGNRGPGFPQKLLAKMKREMCEF